MLDKTYDSSTIEPKISKRWFDEEVFKAGTGAEQGADSFCIVIPPPNVTGSLHMGHALNNTLQDIIIRFERMRQKSVLWQPGMDHAGIATQMVVERQLAEHKEPSRQELGREEFIKRVWHWKEESGGMISNQLRRLGASCDWSRERFTMDEGLSKAVLEVFVRLYKEGLIYKDKRLVNWDTKLKTAISDLEVEQKEIEGNLWHIRYPLLGKIYNSDDPTSYITIATTRPETLLGDVAIAVNPEDERYKDLIGHYAILPIIGRKLLIVADDYADPEAGSGAVKITPAHDFNDFEVGQRHCLKAISILDKSGNLFLKGNEDFFSDLSTTSGIEDFVTRFDQMDRHKARKQIVDLLEQEGYLASIEAHTHMVPHGDRSGTVIEPLLTDQWYVNTKILAAPAIEAVQQGKTKFIPKKWEKTYFEWMNNIQPWCISRQLWWGHQIPAWYGPDGHIFVEKTEEEAQEAAKAFYNKVVILQRDEDVLDTWFSSALWPFSTLGWPEKTDELNLYYPTQTLVTGFDIIFFWVARMMMMGLHLTDEVPFDKVYVHALVRDKYGAKMSKSKGNVINPLDLMDEYGADALRFTLAIMAAQGRDVKLDPARIMGYRNFVTKIWNATRFAQLNHAFVPKNFIINDVKYDINRWILTELSLVIAAVTKDIENYKFNDAADAVYRFVWSNLCDWFIEFSKPVLFAQDCPEKTETQAVLAYALCEVYKLIHPFMPFISEELWAECKFYEGDHPHKMLALTEWPKWTYQDKKATEDIQWLIFTITELRSVRMEMNVPAAAFASLVVLDADEKTKRRIEHYATLLKRLARLDNISFSDTSPAYCVQLLIEGITFCLPLGDLIDLEKERARLQKEKTKIEENIFKLSEKLNNKNFLENASPQIIEGDRERMQNLQETKQKIIIALQRI